MPETPFLNLFLITGTVWFVMGIWLYFQDMQVHDD